MLGHLMTGYKILVQVRSGYYMLIQVSSGYVNLALVMAVHGRLLQVRPG
jgi:hypothetical protein